jgi:hypothetical protein
VVLALGWRFEPVRTDCGEGMFNNFEDCQNASDVNKMFKKVFTVKIPMTSALTALICLHYETSANSGNPCRHCRHEDISVLENPDVRPSVRPPYVISQHG